MLYEVIPTKIFRSGADFLTYSSDVPLKKGQIVKIPLGRSSTVGIVKSIRKSPVDFTVKPIEKLLYPNPLPSHLMKSLLWLSAYYLHPLPSVASLFLPVGVEKSRRKPKSPQKCCKNYNIFPNTPEIPQVSPLFSSEKPPLSSINIPLTPSQLSAISSLKEKKTPTRLLHGITGSGKTNIYEHFALETLKSGKSVVLLVPEIALTSQLVSVFEKTFSRHVILIHSRKTEAERHLIWEHLLTSTEPEIIIGPRSALFAPVKDLGLIIIDESHESTYFQENSPRYSTLRLASFIAKTLNIPCIQGTATPLVSDYYLAKSSDSLVSLEKRAKSTATPPKITIIDLKNREKFKKNRYFSDELLETIKTNHSQGYQTLIFHNRRGSAPLTLCENCGWQSLCPNCFIPLTLHSDSYSLNCHLCGHTERLPHSCPECHTPGVIHKGFGTKLLESELKKLFPSASIARFDADNNKSETLNALYGDVRSGNIDILIGTQTLVKGLDLPHLASVGIIQADSSLNLPDYASEEKTYELLTQVIGRVGRGHLSTASVIIQTYQPTHPAILYSTSVNKNPLENYHLFADYLLSQRKKQHFPPYYFLAKLIITAKTEKTALKRVREIESALHASNPSSSLLISPPTPVFHERSTAGFSWQLILKSRSRSTIISAFSSLPDKLKSKDFHLTLDPPSLL